MGSQQKGKIFELKIVKTFRKWWNLSEKECYRTPVSGGHPYAVRSDITFYPEKIWREVKLFIECKYRSRTRDWSMEDLLYAILIKDYNFSNKWLPFQWLEKIRDKAPLWCLPVVIIGKPRRQPLAIINIKDAKRMSDTGGFLTCALNLPVRFCEYQVWELEEFIKSWSYVSKRLQTPQVLKETEWVKIKL